MPPIFVSGLINIETTLRIKAFPLEYNPVNFPFFGIQSAVAGVGYNVSKALTALGHEVRLCSLIGNDIAATQIRAALAADGIADEHVVSAVKATAQAVILYDGAGRRQIHTDLKAMQEQRYPAAHAAQALQGCEMAVLCNINFNRDLLAVAQRMGIAIACDVHTIADLDDEYNADFMAAADLLFMSHERLPMAPEAWAEAIIDRYAPQILVIGLGADGALLAVPRDGLLTRLPARHDLPVVNTIGAGDALFSAFLHGHLTGLSPHASLHRAITFAAHKIGHASASAGFLTAGQLAEASRV
ncbi:MAG: carbohydrate kinase family protein [Anaerolineales bacterium]|nr:carbohydrate kinase family protein [Anaerolineales bacterium]MCB9126729.1 carbohydrate kinase family protein [Ardenticatenales bacterium]MCB9171729.1 carbohydrate kinase family protein [Ardenticatenales bacterium]